MSGSDDSSDLAAKAQEFADELTATLRQVVPACDPLRARVHETPQGARVYVVQEPDTGLPLAVDGEPLLTLKLLNLCSWDRPQRFLAIDESWVKVYAGGEASGEPLFRYEYVRYPGREQPSAHLQIHAHRDGITYVMTRAGRGSRRGRARADSAAVPAMRELHFPLGGPRYRPCIEDVLEMLVCELGVDCSEEGREALRLARAAWRRKQLAAAVRDAPETAADALAELGYHVEWPADRPSLEGSPNKLRMF